MKADVGIQQGLEAEEVEEGSSQKNIFKNRHIFRRRLVCRKGGGRKSRGLLVYSEGKALQS